MAVWKVIAALVMAALIVAGHAALWASPDWSADAKLRLTLLNAAGWAVIVLPAFAVSAWMRATRRRNRETG